MDAAPNVGEAFEVNERALRPDVLGLALDDDVLARALVVPLGAHAYVNHVARACTLLNEADCHCRASVVKSRGSYVESKLLKRAFLRKCRSQSAGCRVQNDENQAVFNSSLCTLTSALPFTLRLGRADAPA